MSRYGVETIILRTELEVPPNLYKIVCTTVGIKEVVNQVFSGILRCAPKGEEPTA